MIKILLVLAIVTFALSSEKFNSALSAQFAKSSETDFVVMLENIDYTKLSFNGKPYESLDIETRAQFIVDTRIAHAKETQKNIISALQSKNGVTFSSMWIINAIHVVKGTKALAEDLAARSDVVRIVHDQKYEISPMEKTIQENVQSDAKVEWNVEWVKSTALWARGFTGKGKLVGVVDTGANFKHPSLFHAYAGYNNGSYSHDFNWFDPNGRMQEPSDTQDHGSHCTGTILGSTQDKKYITGAAHDAKFISAHFGGTFAAIAKSFQFMTAPTDRQGRSPTPSKRPHVTSHSYGGGGQGRSLLEDVVKVTTDAGVHVIVAAHNYQRCRAVTDPGIIPFVLTVGALGFKSNVIAPFSSKGPNNAHYNNGLKPEISAPGTNVVSASGSGVGYSSKSGTSMATPLVAGVVLQLWQAFPQLDRKLKETNEILYKSAIHTKSRDCESRQETPNNVYGHGTIQAEKAFEIAMEMYGAPTGIPSN